MTSALVVGGGIVGLAVAEELLRRGLSVTLLERSQGLGEEASSAAAGILSPQAEAHAPGPFLDLLLSAATLFPETVTRLEALTGKNVGFQVSGMLVPVLTEAEETLLAERLDWQQKIGMRMERLSAAQIRTLEPALDGSIRWGVWWPQSAQIHPVQLVAAYAQLIERQGGRILTSTAARRFLVEADQVVGCETDQGSHRADWVINCAGSWSGFDSELPMAIPTVPIKGQMLQFACPKPLFRHVIKSVSGYLVQRDDQTLLAGTTVEQAGYNKEVTEAGIQTIQETTQALCSQVGSLSLSNSWAGLRPGTPDGLPLLGPTPLKRFLLATGHYRNGVLLAPLTGRLIADYVTQAPGGLDLTPFQVSRFGAQAGCSS